MLQTQAKEAGDFPASPIAEALPLCCNTSDDVLFANIRSAIDRGHDIIRPLRPHEGVALIVGGGPSARRDVDEIRERQRNGAIIFALNGAGHWLQSHGIVPAALIVLDARAHNARFVKGLDRSVLLLLATQCDPAVFEAGKDHQILAWHPSMNGTSGVVENRPTVLIGGSTTVGMRALRIVHVLGFRQAHLYGYDSSYELGTGSHAYTQPENDGEDLREVEVDGSLFYAPAWMVRQADDFRLIAIDLVAEGLALHVHGSGLLPTIAREMGKIGRAPNAACYDLGWAPASYDFVTWLINAEMDRRRRSAPKPLRVAFVDGPDDGFRRGDVHNVDEKRALLDRVMRPALALFGAVEDETAREGYRYHYWYKPIVERSRQGEDVPRCKVPAGDLMQVAHWLAEYGIKPRAPLVITLREARYSPLRNSNVEAWRTFAQARRAEGWPIVLVRDTAKADEPFDDFLTFPKASRNLWTRAALYSLARCNLIVANGPVALLQFSEWPFVCFNVPHISENGTELGEAFFRGFVGITMGEQLPWHGKHQITVWQRDTVDNLEQVWSRWLENNA